MVSLGRDIYSLPEGLDLEVEFKEEIEMSSLAVQTAGETRKGCKKLARGNPGAISVLAKVAKVGNLAEVLSNLKTAQAYGPRIWLLYKDIHDMDVSAFIHSADQIANLLDENPSVKREWDYYGD